MKRKKLVAAAAIAAMTLSVTGGVYAAPPSATNKDIPVTYDNTLIPDPDHPGDGKWGVSIPAKIAFSDDKKTITGLDVTLKPMNGHDLSTQPDLKVDVSVTSKNGYNVKFIDTPLAYTLTYNNGTADQLLSGTAPEKLTTLTPNLTTLTGTAVLTGQAIMQGDYSDTLTYTIQQQDTTPSP